MSQLVRVPVRYVRSLASSADRVGQRIFVVTSARPMLGLILASVDLGGLGSRLANGSQVGKSLGFRVSRLKQVGIGILAKPLAKDGLSLRPDVDYSLAIVV